MLGSTRSARTSRGAAALLAATILAGSLAMWAEPSAAAKRTSSAGTPSSYTLSRTYTQKDNPVEQQSPGWPTNPDQSAWVRNPTPCAWDVDDTFINWSPLDALLGAGEVSETTECILADWRIHLASVQVISASPDLRVSFTFAEGQTFVVDPTEMPDGRTSYRGCVAGPAYTANAPELREIPDSNHGVAVPSHVTLRIENPGSRRVKTTTKFVIGWNGTREEFCPGPLVWDGLFGVGKA